MKEVIARSRGGAMEIEPDEVAFVAMSDADGELKFISPQKKGEYRIFSYVFDGKGKAGTVNAPFYVK